MSEKVYYARFDQGASRDERIAAVQQVLDATGYGERISAGERVALKTHFGEKQAGGYIKPFHFPPLAQWVRERGAHPFLCETSVLYQSPRCNAVQHLQVMEEHGFGYGQTGLHTIMLDGLLGNQEREVPITGELATSVKLAAGVADCDHILVASHVTGHMMSGLGGCLKNMGMGLASRKGKLQQHSGSKLSIISERCTACGACIPGCPVGAISTHPDGGKAVIDHEQCIGCGECLALCRFGAVRISWDAGSVQLQKRMVEHALGAWRLAGERMLFLNFLTGMSRECDCMGPSEVMAPDLGIMGALDPVALDQATLDLVRREQGERLEALAGYGNFDAEIQTKHGERIRLGTRKYQLVEL